MTNKEIAGFTVSLITVKQEFCYSFFLNFFNLCLSISHSFYLVLQADKATSNYIGVFKMSNISGKRRELVPTKSTTDGSEMDSDSSDSESESEDEGMGGAGPPILQAIYFTHI